MDMFSKTEVLLVSLTFLETMINLIIIISYIDTITKNSQC